MDGSVGPVPGSTVSVPSVTAARVNEAEWVWKELILSCLQKSIISISSDRPTVEHDDALSSLKQLMDTMLNASPRSSCSDGKGRGG